MIAEVSKTVRFTEPEWARFKRLIGLKYTATWADVVKRSLVLFEDQCIADGLIRTYDPADEPKQPQLFQLVELEQPHQLEQLAFEVHARQRCARCKKDKLVNANGNCESCQLVEDSNGQLTIADRLPSTSPATSSPATSSPARPKKPAAPRPKKPAAPRPSPATNGKHVAKKPAARKGVKS